MPQLAEVEAVKQELAASEERVAQLEEEMMEMRDEMTKLEKHRAALEQALEETKQLLAKAAQGATSAGVCVHIRVLSMCVGVLGCQPHARVPTKRVLCS